jgi:hypothetical protein
VPPGVDLIGDLVSAVLEILIELRQLGAEGASGGDGVALQALAPAGN